MERGLFDEACETFEDAKAAANVTGHTSVLLRASIYLALARSRGGQQVVALDKLKGARDAARQQGFESIEAEALFAEATILAATPENNVESIGLLNRSLKISAHIEAEPQRKKTAILLDQIRESDYGSKLDSIVRQL